MLDTNMASYVIKGLHPEIRERLLAVPANNIVVSAVTQGELLYGLARKNHPVALAKLVHEFLYRVDTLPWDEPVAAVYGNLRASCSISGITLGALDMMIAAHAAASGCILVTHDKAFGLIPRNSLLVEDWIKV